MQKIISQHSHLREILLLPGDLHVAFKPTLIKTLLGSCVSVCLFDLKQQIGAMCHGVMPQSNKPSIDKRTRFVDAAINHMISKLQSLHPHQKLQLEAKIFGGADVLHFEITTWMKNSSIGRQNTIAARSSLKDFGIPIVAEKVGGKIGCKIIFLTHTGEVFFQSLRDRSINKAAI